MFAYPQSLEVIRRDGQVRLWWHDTPVDVLLDVHEFHLEVPLAVREVPFAGRTIPVLGCTDLAVFKVMFGRTKDWADIDEVVDVAPATALATPAAARGR